ncbi:MAG: NUDIX domain-containing protein [Coriobacteriales bacterium]
MSELLDTREGDELLEERILDSRPVFRGGFLNVDAVSIELANGKQTVHEVVRHPGAVAIIALGSDGKVLLVRQYRTALERVTLEIPAGKLERGEDPLLAAARELEEETGYIAGRLDYLMPIAVAAGYSDELIHLYMATELSAGRPHPDDDEFVAAEWVDLSVLVDSVLDGRIEDSKTVIAALICDAMRHRL